MQIQTLALATGRVCTRPLYPHRARLFAPSLSCLRPGLSSSSARSTAAVLTFFRRLADLDLSTPLRLEHLRGCDSARRVRVEYRIDHVAASRLCHVSTAYTQL